MRCHNALFIVALFALASSARAANKTWSPSSADYNAGDNWGGSAPNSSDTAVFGGNLAFQPSLSASITNQGLVFATGGYTLSSATGTEVLTLTNVAASQASAGPYTINATNTSGTNVIGAALQFGNGASSFNQINVAGGGALNITGNLTGNGTAALVKMGDGVLNLSGSTSYTGATLSYGAGTMNFSGNAKLSAGNLNVVSGNVNLNGTNQSIAGLQMGGATGVHSVLDLGTEGVLNTSAGGFTFTAANNASALIQGGTIYLPGSFRAWVIGDSAGVADDATVSSVIADKVGVATGIMKSGAGTLVLSGLNTYTSTQGISAGVLSVSVLANSGNASNIGAGSALSISGSSTLRYTGSSVSTNRAFNFAANSTNGVIEVTNANATLDWAGNIAAGAFTNTVLNKTGNGTLALSGSNSMAEVVISAGTLQVGTGGTTGNLNGNVTNNASLAISRSNAYSFASQISGSGSLEIRGTGNTTLTASNSYTGGTKILAGTLTLGNAVSTLADTGAVEVSGGTLNVANSDTVGAVTLSSGTITGAGSLTGSSYSLTNSGVVSAILGGSGALTKSGSGTATLSAANTYSGHTTVAAGTLLVAAGGSLANSSVIRVESGAEINASAVSGGFQLQSGQTLKNKGTLTGDLTALSGSTYAPGNSPGTANQVGNLAFNTGSTFEWELIGNTAAGAGVNFDETIFALGGLTIQTGVIASLVFNSDGSTVDWTNSFWSDNQQWKIFSGASSLSNVADFFTNIVPGNDRNGASLTSVHSLASFSFSNIGDDVYLNYNYNAIPEPKTWFLVAFSLSIVLIAGRRCRNA